MKLNNIPTNNSPYKIKDNPNIYNNYNSNNNSNLPIINNNNSQNREIKENNYSNGSYNNSRHNSPVVNNNNSFSNNSKSNYINYSLSTNNSSTNQNNYNNNYSNNVNNSLNSNIYSKNNNNNSNNIIPTNISSENQNKLISHNYNYSESQVNKPHGSYPNISNNFLNGYTDNNIINLNPINNTNIYGVIRRPSSRKQSNSDIIINTNSNNNISYNKNESFNNKKYEKTNSMDTSKKSVGMENLGNTCFMNTSLQCLLHCGVFVNRLFDFFTSQKPIRPSPISSSFLNLMENYNNKNENSTVSPLDLKNNIGKKHRIYNGYSQQDSQEFIRKLIEEISLELNFITEKKPYKMLNSNNQNKKELNYEYDKIFREREDSLVIDTFYGQSISIFQCLQCHHESYSFEKFLDIPLLLEETFNDQDLSKLLGKYFEGENIQWESPCPNNLCKKKSVHKKKLRLSYLPDILILSLQRYNYKLRRKNTARVNFLQEIDLMEYTDASCLMGNFFFNLIEPRLTKYTLIAISNHSGSLDMGHYYAYNYFLFF